MAASLTPMEREALVSSITNLVCNLDNEVGLCASLRQCLLIAAAVQLSGGGLSEGALLSALTKEVSVAALPLIRSQSSSRATLQACYLTLARSLALVALLDGRPYDALLALHTADRALGASGSLSPSASLQSRSTPSDGLLSGLSCDAPSRGARRASSSSSSSSSGTPDTPPSYTNLEHALVASAILLHAVPGKGAEVGWRPSAVGRAGGLNLRRGALEVLSLVKRAGSEGAAVVVSGERLARLAAATPLSTATGELSPRVWELIGHASLAVGNLPAARVCFAAGELAALPALVAACFLSQRVDEALAIGARCALVLDGIYREADVGEEEHQQETAHAEALPYRLCCWVLGTVMGSFFSASHFSPLPAAAGFALSALPTTSAVDAALGAAANGQPMCGSSGSSIFIPHPLALASCALAATSPLEPPAAATAGLLRGLAVPWNPTSPSAGAWLPTSLPHLSQAAHASATAAAWSPAAAVAFLLRAAGGSRSSSSSSSSSAAFSLSLPPKRLQVVSLDCFSTHCVLLAAHVAAHARPRETQVVASSTSEMSSASPRGCHGVRTLCVYSSGLEGEGVDPAHPPPPPSPREVSSTPSAEPLLGWVASDPTAVVPTLTSALVHFFMATCAQGGGPGAAPYLFSFALFHALSRAAFLAVGGVSPSSPASQPPSSPRASLATLAACARQHLPRSPPFAAVFFQRALQGCCDTLSALDSALTGAGIREERLEGGQVAAVAASDECLLPSTGTLRCCAPNAWVPGRYKVLWAMTASGEEVCGGGGTVAPVAGKVTPLPPS